MKKQYVWLSAACALLLAVTLIAAEKEEKEIDLEGVKCIMNPKADAKAETALEYKGGQVYFCCKNCRKKFEDAPEKAAAKANFQLVATEQATQVKCPLSGMDVNEEQTIEINGVEVSFCCGNCKGKASKLEGDEQLETVFGDKAFEKGFKVEEEEEEEGDSEESEN